MAFANFKRETIKRDVKGAAHPIWLRPSVVPLSIVCGAPGSGKSHYVRQHFSAGDILICFDTIARDLFGTNRPALSSQKVFEVLNERNRMLAVCTERKYFRRAFLIVMEPEARWRSWWWQVMRPAQIIVCATPEIVCLARLADDADKGDVRQPSAAEMVRRWWTLYTPFKGDTLAGG